MPTPSQDWFNDTTRIIDRLPSKYECHHVQHLVLQQKDCGVTDDDLDDILPGCPNLESLVLSGVPDTTDRTIVSITSTATNLQGIDLSNCRQVTDVGVLELATNSLPLQWIQLNGVVGLTDPSISAIAKSCPRLVELELCDLPLLTALSVRDIWSYARKLRTLRLARCSPLTDKAFPSPLYSHESTPASLGSEKPLPPRPTTWLERLPPLILRHTAENLRVLDLANCAKLTDIAIEGIVAHAPRIQTLILSGCTLLTDRAVECISKLGNHLDIVMLAHVSRITDCAVVKLARGCPNLRSVDLAFCRHLTDMAVFELAGLDSLRRLSLVRVHKLTDIALFSLAEHAPSLERLHLSYCDNISLDAVHLMLKKLGKLQHLTATGIPSFKRRGVQRFSDSPPKNIDAAQRAAFRVFSGVNVTNLRKFLDKEQIRLRESEIKNLPFTARSDDRLDLY
jgi:F-box and leucine-rich repeat protein GRR1